VSVWLIITSDMCAVDARGVLHAVKARPKSGRKTYDAACGKRARLLAFPVQGRPGEVMTVRWPVYVAQARDWGYGRCRDCMVASPGRPERVELAQEAS
jgi:hypothetical protein